MFIWDLPPPSPQQHLVVITETGTMYDFQAGGRILLECFLVTSAFSNSQSFQTWMSVPMMLMIVVLTAFVPIQLEVFHVFVIQDLKVMVELAQVNAFLAIIARMS